MVKVQKRFKSEVCGFESCKILDKLQLQFWNYILKLNKYTCSNMIYGEPGAVAIIHTSQM